MVKPKSASRNKRNIGKTIVLIYFHDTVLQILGMCKLPIIDNAGLFKKSTACETIKIRTCNQSHKNHQYRITVPFNCIRRPHTAFKNYNIGSFFLQDILIRYFKSLPVKFPCVE